MGVRPNNKSSVELVLIRLFRVAVGLMVIFVGWLILAPYPFYLPADLSRGFLRNKSEFFYNSAFFIGFYAHIVSAPFALLCGTLQMSRTIRRRAPRWHRKLGYVYCLAVLLLAAPGGLIMSLQAFGGVSSVLCFTCISISAWTFTYLGYQSARSFQFAAHGRWMARSYLMMCSAIALRLIHYVLHPLGLDAALTYQLAAWLSWLPGLILLELAFLWKASESPIATQ
ncbi:MAG: DUF2306 domain-containing protein [Planctomycetota bacterium]